MAGRSQCWPAAWTWPRPGHTRDCWPPSPDRTHPVGTAARDTPARHRFLVRNRLIAALTPVTVVVQAAHRSGALSTARQAAELRRVVLAVPGDVDDAAHVGCNELIRQRVAEMVTRADHVREMVLPLGEGLVATG